MSCGSDNKIIICDTSAVHESAWHDLSPPQSSHFVSAESKSSHMDIDIADGSTPTQVSASVPRIGTRYTQEAFHSDYVKKVKALEGASANDLTVFSVGLDAQLRQSCFRPGGGPLQAVASWDAKSSLYSLGVRKMSDSWHLVATGGSDGLVRVFDTRQEKKPIMKLRSHSEVIKTLYLPEQPTSHHLVSGSADGSIKVWDLRSSKVLNTLAIHEDSVWYITGSKASSSDASGESLKFYSGGRDGSVYLTDVEASQTKLLFKEPFPILCMAPSTDTLWVSTTDAVITRWEVPSDNDTTSGSLETAPHGEEDISRKSINLASSPVSSPVHTIGMQSSVEQVLDSGEEPLIPSLSAEKAISKTPKRNSLVSYAVLPDKIRVITKDSTGRVQLWNVLDLVLESDMGVINDEIEFIAERLSTSKRYLPKWFTADVRSGQLTINIEPYPRCMDANFTDPESIVHCERDAERPFYSAAGLTFRKIFRVYLEEIREMERQSEQQGASSANGQDQVSHPSTTEQDASKDKSKEVGSENAESKALKETKPKDDCLDVLVTLSREGGQHRIRSSEVKENMIPTWVKKTMLESITRPRNPGPGSANNRTVIAFNFKPKRKGIFHPDRTTTVYNMHRAFTVAGMAEWVRDRCLRATGLDIPRSMFKITLEDTELPFTMDIGSIKHFMWKESSPIPLFYDYDYESFQN